LLGIAGSPSGTRWRPGRRCFADDLNQRGALSRDVGKRVARI